MYEDLDTEFSKSRRTTSNRRKIALSLAIGSFLSLIIITVIVLSVTLSRKKCAIIAGGIHLMFPYDSIEAKYVVEFNTTIMQANYVRYISTSGGNGCKGCTFREDPYKIDELMPNDYRYTGYDRGHLVPNADYGYDTYVMDNVVPMNQQFNRGVWEQSEEYIRDKYSGCVIYKGCDYNDAFVWTRSGKKLYIPLGCYYVVLYSDYTLKDYGYYLNEANSKVESKLPYWATCN